MDHRTKALQHLLAWAIQNIFNTHKEGIEIIDDKELTDAQKIEKIKGSNGTDHRLLNLILLLQPALEVAKEEYPDQEAFFTWFDERWKFIQENKFIEGQCACKGCKVE